MNSVLPQADTCHLSSMHQLSLLDAFPLPVWVAAPVTGTIRFVNRAAISAYGYTAEEFRAISFLDLFEHTDAAHLFLQHLNPDRPPQKVLSRHCLKDGRSCIMELYGNVVFIENELLWQLTAVDVTERAESIGRLEEMRNRYRTYIEQSSEGIFCQELHRPISVDTSLEAFVDHLRSDGYLNEVNDVMARMYGYEKASDMIGLLPSQLLDFDDPANIEYFHNFVESGFRIIGAESHEKDRYGQDRYFLNNAIGIVEDGYLKRIWGTQVDITERKKVEQKLQLLATLVEQTTDIIIAADLEFKPITWNSAAEKLIGLTAEQAIGHHLSEYANFRYKDFTVEEVRDRVRRRGEWRGEVFVTRPDNGQQLTLIMNFKQLKDAEGRLRGFIINGTDITERKKTENDIRLLATLVEQSTDMITAADLDFKPITWNPAAEQIFGLKAAHVIGHDMRDLLDMEYINVTRDEVRTTITREGEWRGEMSFVRPDDGRRRTVLIHFTQRKNRDGKLIGYLIGGTDITERKEAEERLQESENRFREVAGSAPVMIWMTDEQDNTSYVNPAWLNFTGRDVESVNRLGWTSLIHPDDSAEAKQAYDEACRSRRPASLVYRMRRYDGQYRWVQDVSIPRFINNDQFIGYIGSVQDITDQKEVEERLRYQATILRNVQDLIVITDLEFRIREFNTVAEQYYCYTTEEAAGQVFRDLVTFDFPSTTREESVRSLYEHGSWKGEVSFVNREGRRIHLLHTITFVHNSNGHKIGIMAVSRDITDRKMWEEKLRESEQFYRTLISDSLNGTILFNEEGIITFVSPSVRHVLGYEPEEAIGLNGFSFVHPDDMDWALQSYHDGVVLNPNAKSTVIRLRKKDGGWVWCLVHGRNLLDNPYVRSVVIYFHDDSERKHATDALKESEKRFRSLIRDMQAGVILYDNKACVQICNRAVAGAFGLKEEDLVGRNIYDIIGEGTINENGHPIAYEDRPLIQVLRTKQAFSDVVMGIRHPQTGEYIWLLVNTDPILNDQGEIIHVLSTMIDITERKKLERKLLFEQITHQKQLTQATIDGQEAERREIGKELHDNIGQQLTTIKLFLDMARSYADDRTSEMLVMAQKGVSDIINEVRSMSRSLVPSMLKDLGLAEAVEELATTIGRTQSLEIEVDHFDFDEDTLPENKKLMLYRIIQEQLNNIIKHAGAGRVIIGLRQQDQGLLLEICDDGRGFDLLATRRGLGLTNIESRAELFGGQVTIESAPAQGCALRVFVPHVVEL